jgi:hypothetical protein
MKRTKSGEFFNNHHHHQKTMNITKILVGLFVCLFMLEHVGRVNDVSVVRPTTYVNHLTYGLGRVWYHTGYICASVASRVYDIWMNLWDYLWKYLKDIEVTFKDIGKSCVDLFVTPKEFVFGFYERAKEFVLKYSFVFIVLINLLVVLVGFYFREYVMVLNDWVGQKMHLSVVEKHKPIAMAAFCFVVLQSFLFLILESAIK